jgi:hypothetical protein
MRRDREGATRWAVAKAEGVAMEAEGCQESDGEGRPGSRKKRHEPSGLRRSRAKRSDGSRDGGERTNGPTTGAALGRGPNEALQRIATRWRLSRSRKATSGPLALRAGVSRQ